MRHAAHHFPGVPRRMDDVEELVPKSPQERSAVPPTPVLNLFSTGSSTRLLRLDLTRDGAIDVR